MWASETVPDKYKYTDSTELYEYYELIGEGGFNKVFRAKFLPTGEIMAVKILKLASTNTNYINFLKEQAK